MGTLALAAATDETAPHDLEDEPRADSEVDLESGDDDALDGGDFDDELGDLDRSEQRDALDRYYVERRCRGQHCRGGYRRWPRRPVIKLFGKSYRLTRWARSGNYLMFNGKKYFLS